MEKISLTGIKPTGLPHIGNYFGAIKPAIKLSEKFKAFYFIADYHALNFVKDCSMLRDYTYNIAAAWLASGLNPEKVMFYRQSDVHQVFELSAALMSFTAKGLMNRAHAYKAVVQENSKYNKDPDRAVNMGLYTYPILMAADILLFDTDFVPVGKDQVQHIEIAADIAETFNKNYGVDFFKIPQAYISEETQVVLGTDGRKMSKSYDNTIYLLMEEKELKKTVMRIVTNSQSVDEKKDPDTCPIFSLYKLFSTDSEQSELAVKYRQGGMGWGDAKKILFEKMNSYLKPIRDEYVKILSDKKYIDSVLDLGAQKAGEIAEKKIINLKKIVGLK